MERRSFFKIVGTASGGVLAGACGKPAREIIPLLVPEREIIAGTEEWHPSICRECSAGCGTIVRMMEAERGIKRGNQAVRERIAAIKKMEGNPLDPVSGGRLCARGQAAVEALYHPDRVRGPLQRSGERGRAAFQPVAWESALDAAAAAFRNADKSKIVFLARPEAGSRSETVAAFLRAIGAPPATSIGVSDFRVERKAAEIVFGWRGLPVYEIQNADYVLSLGADFLGGWISPVFYARRYGHMRRGRPGRRAHLVHAESRFSLTASSADEWLPVRPGGELALALAIGRVLVEENLAATKQAPAGLRDTFGSTDFHRAAQICGLPAARIRDVARNLGQSANAVVLAGSSIVHTNSLDAVIAGSALNVLLGNVGRGVLPPAPDLIAEYAESRPRADHLLPRLQSAELVVMDGVNPAYALPGAAKLLSQARTVVSFSSFLDDSSAYADWILPDHAALESAAVVVPPVSLDAALTGARAIARPLHGTRATEQVLVELGRKLGATVELDTPETAFERVFVQHKPKGDWSGASEFVTYCQRQGGWWAEADRPQSTPARFALPELQEPAFDGMAAEFPLYFQPYPSTQFGDGSSAHLPWLQELPDPASSAMWNLPVEIDPRTAAALGLTNGQMVRVISAHGQLEAPAYVHPAAIPGVVSMAIGQGHAHYSRYASGRGANPLAIVAGLFEPQTGALAFGSTRVRIEKLPQRGKLIQFSTVDREPDIRRT
ncbi:MAG TPA: molybdopterin-dependent oxidoreductase [Bryobacteraceae bacterium]|nr:molybdopterin-dependent oxidoreductase [Bryobacteraceae bacterium]